MSEEKKKGNRGGRREGAGRKPTGRANTVAFRLSINANEKLDRLCVAQGKSRREVVEALISAAPED